MLLLTLGMCCRGTRRESMGLTGQQINYNLVRNYPTLLWFAPSGLQDVGMKVISLVGMALSATVMLVGGSNVFLQTSLWILYHSVRLPHPTAKSTPHHTAEVLSFWFDFLSKSAIFLPRPASPSSSKHSCDWRALKKIESLRFAPLGSAGTALDGNPSSLKLASFQYSSCPSWP